MKCANPSKGVWGHAPPLPPKGKFWNFMCQKTEICGISDWNIAQNFTCNVLHKSITSCVLVLPLAPSSNSYMQHQEQVKYHFLLRGKERNSRRNYSSQEYSCTRRFPAVHHVTILLVRSDCGFRIVFHVNRLKQRRMEFSWAAVMTIHAQKDLMLGKAQPFNIGKAKTRPARPVTPPLHWE